MTPPESESSGITEERIRDLLRELCGSEPPMDRSEDLFESGYLDSLLAIKYVTGIERCFSIAVPTEELTPENFGTISATVQLVRRIRSRC
jgi:acyl carrier protein